jgi:uncharacterized delta-60 repeat protein
MKISPKLALLFALTLLLALPSAASALGQSDLDATFGVGGVLDTGESSYSTGPLLLTQPDGKILFGFQSSGSVRLRRYNADGTPDATFGSGGAVTLSGPNASTLPAVERVLLDPDGTIYVAGDAVLAGVERVAVWALTPNGALKASFNPIGSPAGTHLLPVVGDDSNRLADAARLPSGDLLLISDATAAGVTQIAQRSVHPDGSVGFSTTQGIPGTSTAPNAVAVAADGRFAVAASAMTPIGITGVLFGSTAAGGTDAGFGTGGGMQGLAQLPGLYASVERLESVDGKYLAIGHLSYSNMFLRSAVDGVPDSGFGSAGIARSLPEGSTYSMLSDGIPVAGGSYAGVGTVLLPVSGTMAQVTRVGPDGRLDEGFAPGGTAILPAPGASPFAMAITRQLDGKYVIATTDSSDRVSLLRIWGDHPAPQPVSAAFSEKLKSKTRARKLRRISGTSAGTGVSSIEVAIQKLDSKLLKKSGRCRYIKNPRGTVSRPRAVGGTCVPNVWLPAQGNALWSLSLSKALKPGKYVLSVRATGTLGVGAVTTKKVTLTK